MVEGDQVTCVFCPSTDVPDYSEMCLDCIEDIRSTSKHTVSKPRGLFESPQDKRDEQIAKSEFAQTNSEPSDELVEEDPEWIDSAVFVKSKKKKTKSFEEQLAKRAKIDEKRWRDSQLYFESKPKSSHSPEVRRFEKAQSYLDAHQSSHGKDKTHIFLPFYPASEKGATRNEILFGDGSKEERLGDPRYKDNELESEYAKRDPEDTSLSSQRGKEFVEKVHNPHQLPGPICRLLDRTNLPPRRFWLRENIGPQGPGSKPADSLEPNARISFELYLDLHCIQKRPWPLELWCTHIQFGGAIFDVLRKGGALSRVAGDYMLHMNSEPISERDVHGFIKNVLDLSIADFGPEILIEIEKKTLEILEKLWDFCDYEGYEEGDPYLLQKFIEACCLASFNNEPTVFWKLDTKKQVANLGTLPLTSIPIAYALAEAVHMHLPHLSVDSIIDLAHIDVKSELTNCKSTDHLDHVWVWCFGQLGLDSIVNQTPPE